MPDVKISAGADPGSVVATDKVPLARSASTTAYAATMAELATYANGAYTPNYYAGTPSMDGAGAAGTAAFVARGDHVHPSDTSRAPLASPTFTGDPKAPTPSPGDNDTSIATTAFVLNAVTGGTAAAIPGQSYADNGGFAINQRTYVSGTALAAAAFGHDRWKGGASGCTYTFAASSGPSRSITITAGSLQQVVEGASIAGGNYMLSWTGTAQGRVGAGSYAASPVAVTGIVAGANTTIEFNAGTLSQVKFEAGTVATPWVAQSARNDLANCQRFYSTGTIANYAYMTSGGLFGYFLSIPTMRAAPVIAFSNLVYGAASGITAQQQATGGFTAYATATATGGVSFAASYTASADL